MKNYIPTNYKNRKRKYKEYTTTFPKSSSVENKIHCIQRNKDKSD